MKFLLLALTAIAPISACSECYSDIDEMQIISQNIRCILEELAFIDADESDYRNILLEDLNDEVEMLRSVLKINNKETL